MLATKSCLEANPRWTHNHASWLSVTDPWLPLVVGVWDAGQSRGQAGEGAGPAGDDSSSPRVWAAGGHAGPPGGVLHLHPWWVTNTTSSSTCSQSPLWLRHFWSKGGVPRPIARLTEVAIYTPEILDLGPHYLVVLDLLREIRFS